MTRKELETHLQEIDGRLKSLGDLNLLVEQTGSLVQRAEEFESLKANSDILIAQLSSQKDEADKVIEASVALKGALEDQTGQATELLSKVEELKQETLQQLGLAASEKLSNSFEQVKDELQRESESWFRYMIIGTIALVIAAALIAVWQVRETSTLYDVGFLVKIGLTSPFVYFIVFVAREFKRVRHLKEEYTFKAAIARSFEAYKEILEELFKGQQGEVFTKHLDFIISSVGGLYSSPMTNIKANYRRERELTPDILPRLREFLLSQKGE